MQGAYSVQAILIAEELDVELDQVNVNPCMPDKAYYNTTLGADGAPFAPTDEGWLSPTNCAAISSQSVNSFTANSTRTVMDSLMKFLGMQITGGSTTVPDSYEKLRLAGTVARETLKSDAAEQTDIICFDDTEAKAMRGVQKALPITGGIAVLTYNTWCAIQGANVVEIEWGADPYTAEMEAHWQTLSDSFNEGQRDSRQRDDGDVVSSIDGADVIEAEHRAP